MTEAPSASDILQQLAAILKSRKNADPDSSYVARLYAGGLNAILKKVGEEATELIIEAKDNNEQLFLNEAADLMYHYLLLLSAKGFSLEEVEQTLVKRAK